jgi:hypothetical protein
MQLKLNEQFKVHWSLARVMEDDVMMEEADYKIKRAEIFRQEGHDIC